MVGQPGEHGVAPLPVHLAEDLDLAPPVVVAQVGGHGELGERRRAQRRRLLGQHELLPDGVRGEHPADPEAGRERLGERTQVDDPLVVHRAHRRDRLGVEAEQPVRVVLDDQQVGLLRDLQHPGPPLQGLGDAGRVVEVGDRVEELGLLAGRAQRGHRLAERDRVETVLVHGHVHDLALVGPEHAERTDVAGGLAQHHVARVAEDPGDQVETLLGADGDGDVVGVRADALELHHLADRLPEHRLALAGAVLHGTTAVGDHQIVQGVADHVERQVGDVGHPAGQRDDLRTVGHGEQGADGRGGHAVGASGVPVDVAVQPGVAALQALQPRGSGAVEPVGVG